MNRTCTVGLLVAMGLALTLRFPRLEERPMHNDEAVNAVKFGDLLEHGRYIYDPNEHHGPSLFYSTLAMAKLAGAVHFSDFTRKQISHCKRSFGTWLIALLPHSRHCSLMSTTTLTAAI